MSDRQDGDKQILARIDGALKKYDTPGLPVRMLAVVYGIACGISGTILSKHIGITIGKNAFICYIKDVGMVCAEALERNRRDPSKKHKNAQADETVSQ